MRNFRLGLTSISSLVFVLSAPSALAGNCGSFSGPNCDAGVVYNNAGAAIVDPLHVNIAQPLSGARSVHIRTAPSVSITRLYGQQHALAGIKDAPSGFAGVNSCTPTTTQYCRQPVSAVAARPVQIQAAPQFIAAPVVAAPIVAAPIVQQSVRVGSGYNPAAFAPRQYGEDVFTPGIAHVPTSYVDRSPHTAERLLQSGTTRTASHRTFNPVQAAPIAAPVAHSFASHSTVTSHVASPVTAHVPTGKTTPVDANGGYWEEVSGPTLFGDTLATRVVCRRQAPVQQVEVQTQQVYTQVVRPVVHVPTPYPVYCEPTEVKSRYSIGNKAVKKAAKVKQPSFANFNGGQAPFIQAPHAGLVQGAGFGQVPFAPVPVPQVQVPQFQAPQFQAPQFQGPQLGQQFQGSQLAGVGPMGWTQ